MPSFIIVIHNHHILIAKMALISCNSIFFLFLNWDSLRANLNSHCKVRNGKKKYAKITSIRVADWKVLRY